MRELVILAGCGLLASASVSAQPVTPPVATVPIEDPRVAQLQQQLLTAQGELQQLRAAMADAQTQKTALEQCRDRNEKLVAAGNDLVAAYTKRYARSRFEPFQLGRAKFENALQDRADEIYKLRHDYVPPRPPVPEAVNDQLPSADSKTDTNPQ